MPTCLPLLVCVVVQVVVSSLPAGVHTAGTPAGAHSSKATVAITGGSGGLGLLMAQWLAASAAITNIHLYSRQGRLPPATAAASSGLMTLAADGNTAAGSTSGMVSLQNWLLGSGVCVTLHSANTSCSSDLQDMMAGGGSAGPCEGSRGRGGFDVILHAAGTLQDSLISNQTQSSIRAVMAPKLGAGRVHNMLSVTAAMPLQQLVLFSSVASCLGAAGQANYVSANAVLDGWAMSGRRQGAAVTSVQWGAWATAGKRHRWCCHPT